VDVGGVLVKRERKEFLNYWEPCNDDEAKAARALLETGLEKWPAYALERAHAVMEALGLLRAS
jgi:hypothetical protein